MLDYLLVFINVESREIDVLVMLFLVALCLFFVALRLLLLPRSLIATGCSIVRLNVGRWSGIRCGDYGFL